MEVLGFSAEDQDSIFRILASILHLGNVYFEKDEVRALCHRTAFSGHGRPPEAESCQLTAGSTWSTIWAPPSSRAEGLLFLHGLESNPGSSLQTEEEAGLP